MITRITTRAIVTLTCGIAAFSGCDVEPTDGSFDEDFRYEESIDDAEYELEDEMLDDRPEELDIGDLDLVEAQEGEARAPAEWSRDVDPAAYACCEQGDEIDGLLCYPECIPGYHGVGPVCWEDCAPGYTDMGLTCVNYGVWGWPTYTKHSYGRGVGYWPLGC